MKAILVEKDSTRLVIGEVEDLRPAVDELLVDVKDNRIKSRRFITKTWPLSPTSRSIGDYRSGNGRCHKRSRE